MGWQVVPCAEQKLWSLMIWYQTPALPSLTGTSRPVTELCPSALCKKDFCTPRSDQAVLHTSTAPCSCPSQSVTVVTTGSQEYLYPGTDPQSRMMVWSTAPDTHCLPRSRQQRNVSSVSQWTSRSQTPHKEVLPIKDHLECKNPINLNSLREKKQQNEKPFPLSLLFIIINMIRHNVSISGLKQVQVFYAKE